MTGATSSDGNLFVIANGHPGTNRDAGLILGVKQGSAMSNASLNGTYNFASFEFDLGSNSNSTRSEAGTITLNGSGGLSGSLLGTETRVDSRCASGSVCPSPSVTSRSKSESPPTGTTYSVSATGAVTITSGGSGSATISGFASPDGNIVVLTQAQDGTIGSSTNGESNRGLFVLIK